MAEELITSYSSPTQHAIDLSLSMSGLTITVGAGSIVSEGTSYALASSEAHTVGSYAVSCTVMGSLVLDASNSLHVFVDEFVHDGVDVTYDFDSSPYTLVSPLYLVEVPAGTTDLSTLSWKRWKIVAS